MLRGQCRARRGKISACSPFFQRNSMKRLWPLLIFSLFMIPFSAPSQDKTEAAPAFGYRDADGDGKNDITGKPYSHQFRFVDADGDGINDIFRDANGDGNNDIARINGKNGDRDKAEGSIDANGDGVNDITEKRKAPLQKTRQKFIDENADGLSDQTAKETSEKPRIRGRKVDRFTDRDGDGINDGRGLERANRDRVIEMENRITKGKEKSRKGGK